MNVTWLVNDTEIALGTMNLTQLSAKHKRATIDQNVVFDIADEDAFGTFTETMITQPNFTWHLVSNGLRVNALKFPVATGIHFNKKVTLKGIDGFNGNVKLVDFQVSEACWLVGTYEADRWLGGCRCRAMRRMGLGLITLRQRS